jgi:hypothetical protein
MEEKWKIKQEEIKSMSKMVNGEGNRESITMKVYEENI